MKAKELQEKRIRFFKDNSNIIQRIGDGRIVIYDKTYKDESSNLVLTPSERDEYYKLKATPQPDLGELEDILAEFYMFIKYPNDVDKLQRKGRLLAKDYLKNNPKPHLQPNAVDWENIYIVVNIEFQSPQGIFNSYDEAKAYIDDQPSRKDDIIIPLKALHPKPEKGVSDECKCTESNVCLSCARKLLNS